MVHFFELHHDIFETKSDVIVHQVNCKGVMNAGLAREVRKRYPQHYFDYMDIVKSYFPTQRSRLLGSVIITKNDNGPDIAGIFAQDGYGRGKQFTDYDAFAKAFRKVCRKYREIAVPYGIGCGLGGGKWNTIKRIMDEVANDGSSIYGEIIIEICNIKP